MSLMIAWNHLAKSNCLDKPMYAVKGYKAQSLSYCSCHISNWLQPDGWNVESIVNSFCIPVASFAFPGLSLLTFMLLDSTVTWGIAGKLRKHLILFCSVLYMWGIKPPIVTEMVTKTENGTMWIHSCSKLKYKDHCCDNWELQRWYIWDVVVGFIIISQVPLMSVSLTSWSFL